jgi:hypothetical protein
MNTMEEFYNSMSDVLTLKDGKLVNEDDEYYPIVKKYRCRFWSSSASLLVFPSYSTIGVVIERTKYGICANFGVIVCSGDFETEDFRDSENCKLLKQIEDLANESPFEDSLIKIIQLVDAKFKTLYD